MANFSLLLADDSVTIQKVVNLTFAGEGIDVISVGDGNSAMDILRERLPDLVMADVNIPGVNGYEICEKVKSMDRDKKVPVILLVGSFEPFDSEEAARVGADSHLTKPFESIAALVDTVHALLGDGTEARRFDDTVEYPTGADLVVDHQSLGFAGGFEDDTIEAEHMGAVAETAEPEQPAVNEYGFETGGYETSEAESAREGDDDQSFGEFPGDAGSEEPLIERDYGPLSYDEPAPAEATTGDFGFDAGGFDQPVGSPAEDAGGTYTDFIDGGGEDTRSQSEPEVSESTDFGHEAAVGEYSQEEPAEEDRQEDNASESYYREESYYQSTEYSEPAPPVEAEDHRFDSDDFEPESAPEAGEPGYAPVTVELDELELLELPIDRSVPEASEEPPVFSLEPEDQFSATIREPDFAGPTASEISGADIPPELIDEIARRVVEKLTEKAVREIAWEVVPDMAEIIIRKMMEERLND